MTVVAMMAFKRQYCGVLLLGLMFWCGCPVSQSQDFPAPLLKHRTFDTDRGYYLYVPSTYHPSRQWPLVVTCHGTRPYDSARSQVREWAAMAELYGFIVAAPELVGTRADLTLFRSPAKQIEQQLRDEKVLLQVVQSTKVAYNVAEDRVFLTGWSAGAYAVLFTGLKNPRVFRCLAIREGNFDARYLGPILGAMDRHQPVLVFLAAGDVLVKSQTQRCYQWLKKQGMNVHYREIAGGHARRPDVAYRFFRDSVKRYPWVHAEAAPGKSN